MADVNDGQQPEYNDMAMDGAMDGNDMNMDGADGDDAEGNVDQYFDDAGDVYLPADHPLMSRVQNALTK